MVDINSFSCFQDIETSLEFFIEKQDRLYAEIKKISIGIFNPNRAELKIRKKALKSQLKQLKADISAIYELLEEYTTFDSDIFLPFLTDYLSLKENEQYILIEDVEEFNVYLAIATKTFPLNLFGDEYKIITTDSNCQKLEEESESTLFGDTSDIDDFLSVCEDEKYVCLDDDDEYTLLDGTDLDEDYENYPYLLDLAYELIDLKLSNPYLSDEDRLNMVLSNTRGTPMRPIKK